LLCFINKPELEMLKSKRMALASLVIIFLLGIILGVAGERYIFRHWHPQRHGRGDDFMIKDFTQKLNLTVDQQQQLKVLLGEIREKYEQARASMKPEFEKISQEFRDKFAQILDEKQKPIFDQMNKEFDSRENEKNRDRRDRDREKRE